MSINASAADPSSPLRVVIAETVCQRLQHGEGRGIGLLLGCIGAARREGNLHVMTGLLGRSLNRGVTRR